MISDISELITSKATIIYSGYNNSYTMDKDGFYFFLESCANGNIGCGCSFKRGSEYALTTYHMGNYTNSVTRSGATVTFAWQFTHSLVVLYLY